MSTERQVQIPDIGDFSDVPVIDVLVSVGEWVNEEDALITLESDKATMDVPSPYSGIVKALTVRVGDTVSQGSPILTLELADAGFQPRPGDGAEASVPAAPETTDNIELAEVSDETFAAGPSLFEVRVPDIGDFTDVPVIEVMVATGDRVVEEQPLVTLESDKATMDVPSPRAGTVKSVGVRIGDQVSEGSPLLVLEVSEKADAPPPDTGEAPPQDVQGGLEPAPPASTAGFEADVRAATGPEPSAPTGRPSPTAAIAEEQPQVRPRSHATPAIRRFARELGVDLAKVTGSGRKGRILKDDVQRFVKGELARPREVTTPGAGIPPLPIIDFGRFGEIETQPLSRIKKLSGPHLHRAWLNVPHVTHHDEADITELEAFRRSLKDETASQGVRLTLLAFLVKALAGCLREFPSFNASLASDGEHLVLKKYFHIGVAVDTPGGLVVPVIRTVDKKGVLELARELGEISLRAREGKLRPDEMQGGCMSISSLGGIGGTAFTPIVNAPEVAILGVTRARMAPVWSGEAFVPRLMLPLDLSYDHRIVDGAEAARFVIRLCQLLGDVRRMLL